VSDEAVHHLLLYEYVEGMAERRGPYREEHLAGIRAERDAGRLIMAGALGNPPTGGAFVFRGVEREAVEAFAQADPYTRAGLVTSWRAERWNLVQ
jgi:uncharacterized protein